MNVYNLSVQWHDNGFIGIIRVCGLHSRHTMKRYPTQFEAWEALVDMCLELGIKGVNMDNPYASNVAK